MNMMVSEQSALDSDSTTFVGNVVMRKRLFDRLDQMRRASIVWIAGPAGSGKTTLISSYLKGNSLESLWHAVNPADVDLANLFYHISEQVSSDEKRECAQQPPLFTSEYHDQPIEFARRYFRTLYSCLSPPPILVLDDINELPDDAPLYDLLETAVSVAHPDGCIFILSRDEPPPQLIRLRANRDMELMLWRELKLTQQESDQIISLLRPDIDSKSHQTLYSVTGGWAAGLVLRLDLALEDESEIAFMDQPNLIFDYLAGEVFSRLSKELQKFLLDTAFLPELTVEMATALSKDTRTGEKLATLYRRHHLITQTNTGNQNAYKCHPLLTQFLQAECRRRRGHDGIKELLQATAVILEREERITVAMKLLFEVGDQVAIAQMVLRHARKMLIQGRSETLDRWIKNIDLMQLEDCAELLYWKAESRFQRDPNSALKLYEQAFERYHVTRPDDIEGQLMCCTGFINLVIYILRDLKVLDKWIIRIEDLLRKVKKPIDPISYANISSSMFLALVCRRPNHPDFQYWFQQAEIEVEGINETYTRVWARLAIATNYNHVGKFAKSKSYLAKVAEQQDNKNDPLPSCSLRGMKAMYYLMAGDGERCLQAVYDGLDICDKHAVQFWRYFLLTTGMGGALVIGDLKTAGDIIKNIESANSFDRTFDESRYHWFLAWYYQQSHQYDKSLAEHQEANRLVAISGFNSYEVLFETTYCLALCRVGRHREAVSQLRIAREHLKGIPNRNFRFMWLCNVAQIAISIGRQRLALAATRAAVNMGAEFGYYYFPWWLNESMAKVCQVALANNLQTEYVRKLIYQRDMKARGTLIATRDWPRNYRVTTLDGTCVLDKNLHPLNELSGKPLSLLLAIISLGCEGVAETKLATELWPNVEIEYSLKSLNSALHRLRKQLGSESGINVKLGRITLDPDLWWIDIKAFDEVCDRIDNVMRLPFASVELETVENCGMLFLGLYKQPYLADMGEEPWILFKREHCRSRFLRGLSDMARWFEKSNALDSAIWLYKRGIEVEPLAEGCYRKLMLLHRSLGQHAEALDVYSGLQKAFAAELGVSPSPDTRAIYDSLVKELRASYQT